MKAVSIIFALLILTGCTTGERGVSSTKRAVVTMDGIPGETRQIFTLQDQTIWLRVEKDSGTSRWHQKLSPVDVSSLFKIFEAAYIEISQTPRIVRWYDGAMVNIVLVDHGTKNVVLANYAPNIEKLPAVSEMYKKLEAIFPDKYWY